MGRMGIFFLVVTINFTSLTAVFLHVSLGGHLFLSAFIVLFHHSIFHMFDFITLDGLDLGWGV